MIFIMSILGLAYLISLGLLIFGFWKLPLFSEKVAVPRTQFTIIIPYRNEAENLPKLLDSLLKLNYPSKLYEVILVDDASEDLSATLIKQTLQPVSEYKNFRIIKNERRSASPKKDAITTAIENSTCDWILTTDADCVLPPNWLNTYDGIIQKEDPTLVAGPVQYSSSNTISGLFQRLDGLSLQLVTMGFFGWRMPILCNGANLAYTREAFIKVNGFADNNHIASGDDIFILEKLRNLRPGKILFLKSAEAIVITQAQKNWTEIIDQRIRWASKTSKQKILLAKLLGLLVFLTNFMLLFGLIFSIFQPYFLKYYITYFVIKIVADFIVIFISNGFFRSNINYGAFFISTLFYPIITVLVVLGSFKGTYHWKGRKYEKQP